MKTPLLETLRGLILSVHKDCVAKVDPGILRSRAYRRDRKYLATASQLELLRELPLNGKKLDRSLCANTWSDFNLACSSDSSPVPGRFSYLLDGVRQGNADSVGALRQLMLLYAKYEVAVEAGEAIDSFVRRQAELPTSIPRTPLVRVARDLCHRLLSNLDWEDIIPRHGPGALATGEKPWEKMEFRRIYLDMQGFYPADKFFFFNSDHLTVGWDSGGLHGLRRTKYPGVFEKLPFVELPDSHCSLVAVPKDFRGPRIIAMEALEKQWIQQGQRRILVRRLEAHPLSRGYVNFSSQDVNRRLALESSITGEYATLDLKDASDRVSFALCQALVPEPAFSYLRASRSVRVKLPSGDLIPLQSFSPMGSAVCFPLESLIFYALSLSAIHLASKPLHLFPSAREWRKYLGKVYVYGDDLIVTHDFSQAVVEALESVGLVVNRDKCCLQGPFRESCGLDAFNGRTINPVRIKHLPDRRTPSSFPSAVSYLNEFRSRGMVNSFDYLMSVVENEFGTVPMMTVHDEPCAVKTPSSQEALMWNMAHFRSRFNQQLQRTEWRVPVTSPAFRIHAIPGWSQYLRVMTACPHGQPDDWSKNEDEWSVPHALRLNMRWRPL